MVTTGKVTASFVLKESVMVSPAFASAGLELVDTIDTGEMVAAMVSIVTLVLSDVPVLPAVSVADAVTVCVSSPSAVNGVNVQVPSVTGIGPNVEVSIVSVTDVAPVVAVPEIVGVLSLVGDVIGLTVTVGAMVSIVTLVLSVVAEADDGLPAVSASAIENVASPWESVGWTV